MLDRGIWLVKCNPAGVWEEPQTSYPPGAAADYGAEGYPYAIRLPGNDVLEPFGERFRRRYCVVGLATFLEPAWSIRERRREFRGWLGVGSILPFFRPTFRSTVP